MATNSLGSSDHGAPEAADLLHDQIRKSPLGGPGPIHPRLADVRWESVTVEPVVTLRALVDLRLVRCAENSAESRAS